MKYAARWKVLLHAIRIFGTGIHLNCTETGYYFDGRTIDLRYDDFNNCYIIDWDTGEVICVYSEDGTPSEMDNWMEQPMSIDGTPTDYPLYDL